MQAGHGHQNTSISCRTAIRTSSPIRAGGFALVVAPPQTHAAGSQAETADLKRLERLAEQAYAAMYDVPPLRSAKGDYESACLYFQRAIEEAERLGLSGEA